MRAGLGNMLIPWARAEAFAHQTNLPILAPIWSRPKIGPILRREADTRLYLGQFSNKDYITGPKRWHILATAQRITPEQAQQELAGETNPGTNKPALVVFSGYDGWFNPPLLQNRQHVADKLWNIVTPKVRAMIDEHNDKHTIGVHVRRGDFKIVQQMKSAELWAIPDEWFVSTINAVRKHINDPDAQALVFSDAPDQELTELLSAHNVRRAKPAPAIADILRLSKSPIFIPTGMSSFSGWAAYIGNMPTIWHPSVKKVITLGDGSNTITADQQGNIQDAAANILRAAANKTKPHANPAQSSHAQHPPTKARSA